MNYNIPYTESPFFEKEIANADLSEEDRSLLMQYAENGYVIIDPGIDAAVIEQAKTSLEGQFQENATLAKNLQNRIQDAWTYNESVRQIASAPRVLKVLELLYRRKPIPFQTLNFKVGTEQRTHSDMIHFSSIPERFMCGVWVALEDVHELNGPLHYYPQSHKMKFYDMLDMGVMASASRKMKNQYMDYSDFYENFIEEVIQSKGLKKSTLNVKKGQALIWAANLLHGGDKILQPGSTRQSQVTHYYFEDCLYYTPLFSDLGIKKMHMRQITDITTGKPVQNSYLGKPIDVSRKERLLRLLPKPLAEFLRSLRS
jgi:hypothetical protein